MSVLIGSGGNIGVMTGRDGKVLIEAGIPASGPQLTEALKSLGGDPIKHLINTHWHFDHTDGNEWLHAVGAEIKALEKESGRRTESKHRELTAAPWFQKRGPAIAVVVGHLCQTPSKGYLERGVPAPSAAGTENPSHAQWR